MTTHRYVAFGLRIESARIIPAMVGNQTPFAGRPDVEILEGEVSTDGELEAIGDGVQVCVEGETVSLIIAECGRFQVVGGRKITVQPHAPATSDQVNAYLLGSVFGALLHQRRLIPFHCNAVEIEGSAFLFCGPSGAGKSTLAAHFVERGYRLLSDDLCALHFSGDGRLVASPGVARLKLWADALEAFGRSAAGLTRVPWTDSKFEMAVPPGNWRASSEVAAVYDLRLADGTCATGIHPVRGLDAAHFVIANVYRRRLAELAGAGSAYLAGSARIVDQIPVFTMNRNWGFAHFREEAMAAEAHMRQLVRDSAR